MLVPHALGVNSINKLSQEDGYILIDRMMVLISLVLNWWLGFSSHVILEYKWYNQVVGQVSDYVLGTPSGSDAWKGGFHRYAAVLWHKFSIFFMKCTCVYAHHLTEKGAKPRRMLSSLADLFGLAVQKYSLEFEGGKKSNRSI